jgi:hypothetical protein
LERPLTPLNDLGSGYMRCYFMARGRIVAVEVLTATRDDDGIKQALALFQQREGVEGFELWERDRFIYRYPDDTGVAPRLG